MTSEACATVGARVRQRRLDRGLKQVDLARACGISASYLNAMERGRRPVGGALLLDLAAALGTEATALSEEAGPGLLTALREAAAEMPGVEPAETLAARCPGWAAAVGAQAARLRDLEGAVEALGDRLSHDPELASALHEMLSAAAGVRAAAAILAEPGEIDPAWHRRFLRTIAEDSARLAAGADTLVDRVGARAAAAGAAALGAPSDTVEAWFAARHGLADRLATSPEGRSDEPDAETTGPGGGRRIPGGTADATAPARPGAEPDPRPLPPRTPSRAGSDPGAGAVPADLLRDLPADPVAAATVLRWLRRFAEERRRLPEAELTRALAAGRASDGARGPSDDVPSDLSRAAHILGLPLSLLLRRLAFRPGAATTGGPDASPGLVICDASGVSVFRRAAAGFAMARRDAQCPLWPLYDALGAPGRPVRAVVETAGPSPRRFEAWAVADAVRPEGLRGPALVEATMLILPGDPAGGAARPIGPGCRACPREGCAARRDPAILAGPPASAGGFVAA